MGDIRSITAQIEQHIQSQEFKLPVFNQVAIELQKTLAGDFNIKDAEQLILKDQAIAGEILRVANSAFFSGLNKIANIQQALSRLGVMQVLSIVMLAAQKQAFKARHPFLNKTMQRLWQHASASAGGCRWLAMKYGYNEQRDIAFLAGLLHDLGSLVILKVLDELCLDDTGVGITEPVMIELISSLHTRYGHMVMEAWELPQVYCEIARDHHLEQADDKHVILQIVRLVDAACSKVGIGLEQKPELVLEAMPEAHSLGVKAVHLAELEIQLEDFAEQFA